MDRYLVCRGTNLSDVHVVMDNKREPAESPRWFSHGTRRCVNVQSEVRIGSFSIRLVFSVESCKMASKPKGQFVSVGFITNWNFEMLAAMSMIFFTKCFVLMGILDY